MSRLGNNAGREYVRYASKSSPTKLPTDGAIHYFQASHSCSLKQIESYFDFHPTSVVYVSKITIDPPPHSFDVANLSLIPHKLNPTMAEVEAQAVLNGDSNSKQEESKQPDKAADELPVQDEKLVEPSTSDTIKETATDKVSQKIEKPTAQVPQKIEKPMSAHQQANGQRRSNGANQGKRYNERPQRGGKRFDKNFEPRRNNKFEPNLPDSDDPAAIRKQVRITPIGVCGAHTNRVRSNSISRNPIY